jgi:peptidoglycan hydrolase CwlO-like protein
VRETKRAVKLTKKLEAKLKTAESAREKSTSKADEAIKRRDVQQVKLDKMSQKRLVAQKEVETLRTLIFDTQQFAREMQQGEDQLQSNYERYTREIAILTNKIGTLKSRLIVLFVCLLFLLFFSRFFFLFLWS